MESWRILERLISPASGAVPVTEATESKDSAPYSNESRKETPVEINAGSKIAEGKEEVKRQAAFPDSGFEKIIKEIASTIPELKEIVTITPPPGFRIVGQKIPRESHRFSGRTAMHANVDVSEPKPTDDPDSPLTFTMEGYRGEPPSSIIPFFWSPGWNSVQSINKYQIEVGGPLHGGDPGRRLFEKNESATMKYFDIKQKKFERKNEGYLAVPIYHIYGSEELSSEALAVQQLIPELCVWMNPDDAAEEGIKKDENIEIESSGKSFKLPVKIKLDLPQGTVGFPVLPGKTIQLSAGVSKVKPAVEYNKWLKVKKNAD